jgi:hypothetical protein
MLRSDTDNRLDSKEQITEFNADNESYTQYAREVEGELNKRFTLVIPLLNFSRLLTDPDL